MSQSQELTDWKNHPITRNYYEGVELAIKTFKDSLSELDTDFNEREIARKIGVIQGLEALLTYEPMFDEDGNLVEEDYI